MNLEKELSQRYPIKDSDALRVLNPPVRRDAQSYQWHHILPVSMFPKYENRKRYPQNLVHLSGRDHYKAHYLLYRAVGGKQAAGAWWMMHILETRPIYTEHEAILFEEARAIIALEMGKSMKGMITAKNSIGEVFHVRKDDPRLSTKELVHNNTGTINVRDKNGNCFKTLKSDPRLLRGELVHVRVGMTMARDRSGSILSAAKNDPRFLTGELVQANKGRVVVVDSEGNHSQVRCDDPRYISGELKYFKPRKPKSKSVIPEKQVKSSEELERMWENRSKSHLGKKRSLESVAKMVASRLGKPLSSETKLKISESHMGLRHSKDTRQKMRESHLGSKRSPEAIFKMKERLNDPDAKQKRIDKLNDPVARALRVQKLKDAWVRRKARSHGSIA
jgi:hypothetical protein